MALPTTTYVVNGREYTTTLLTATESCLMLPRIVTLLGREITQLLLATSDKPAAKPSDGDAGEGSPAAPVGKSPLDVLLGDSETMFAMFHTVCTNAMKQGGDGLLLLRDLLNHTTCKHVQLANGMGEAPLSAVFDEHFAGEFADLVMVCMHATRASFIKPSRK